MQSEIKNQESNIPSLLPRGSGHQFVFYGDCCSGVPGRPNEENFKAVNAVVQRLDSRPEFIAFIGDHIMGMSDDRDGLRSQWRYWLDHEMAWLDRDAVPVYHTTSNHNTYSAESEQVWREFFPDLPQNGPTGQEGLSYWLKRDDLLLVIVNTSFSGLGGNGHVESEWLDQVLVENADTQYKLVLGHYPVFPVNGYDETPHWCVDPDQGRAFWNVLVRNNVIAYLCSHIIAFDVQTHEGVLQVMTGGAGTEYGPDGFMPGPIEYHHTVQAALDAEGFRYQVLDTEGKARESLAWPINLPPLEKWHSIPETGFDWPEDARDSLAIFFQISGEVKQESDRPLISGFNESGQPSIEVRSNNGEVQVRLETESGNFDDWKGGSFASNEPLDFQVAIHRGMGPGGILWRVNEESEWSSLISPSAQGAEDLSWPFHWKSAKGLMLSYSTLF